ncbi:MAG: hypothetical protein WDW38_006618 [Sanguina aurantia]
MLVIVVGILLCINLRVYYLCPFAHIEVAQTDLASATDLVLMERRPLVIVDRIADHLEMIRMSALRLLHVRASPPVPLMGMRRVGGKDALHRATARFTLIYQAHSESTVVEVHHPSTSAGVVIVLRRHQTLVLPPRWRYVCPNGALVHELHDSVSLALRLVGATHRPSPAV